MESYVCKTCLMLTAPFYLSQKFQQKLRLHIPFTTYYGLLNSIPASWRRKLKFTDSPNLHQISSSDSPKMDITTRSAYAAILVNFFQPPTSETKILRCCFAKNSLTNVYMMPFLITQEVKLQMFQLKIIHNMLPTRRSLFRARLSYSDSCRACQTEPETFPHMLFQCNTISAFWIAFQQWWRERTLRTFELNECNEIYGWYDTQFKDVLNYVTLVAKYLIFCCFQDNTAITFDRFPSFLSNKIYTLRQIALKNKQLEEFNKKWKNFT